MKKLIASVILMLACFCFSASAQPGHYRHNRPYRGYYPRTECRAYNRNYHQRYVAPPARRMPVVYGNHHLWYGEGRYYRMCGNSRYSVVLPPIGLQIGSLYRPVAFYDRGGTYYIENGVIYNRIRYGRGYCYRVVRYR